MVVGGNDVPKNSPLTLMKYKCFLAGYQKPAKLVKSVVHFELLRSSQKNDSNKIIRGPEEDGS
jgi:hypothetical protein